LELARKNWLKKMEITTIQPEQKESGTVFVQNGAKIIKIETAEILFLQALDNYSIIQTHSNKTIVSSYLSQLFANFSSNPDFFLVHRSYVINLKKINSINGNMALIDKFEIPISRSNKNELLSKLKMI
jgi:DNA-binding LytR/AlgR family response regulator